MIDSIDALSILDNYITALIALERKVSIDENDIILINVGISGISLAAIDLATNVYRAKVLIMITMITFYTFILFIHLLYYYIL